MERSFIFVIFAVMWVVVFFNSLLHSLPTVSVLTAIIAAFIGATGIAVFTTVVIICLVFDLRDGVPARLRR